jgi:hypothetical protein
VFDWLDGELSFLAPCNAGIFHHQGVTIGVAITVLFLNLCAAYYRIAPVAVPARRRPQAMDPELGSRTPCRATFTSTPSRKGNARCGLTSIPRDDGRERRDLSRATTARDPRSRLQLESVYRTRSRVTPISCAGLPRVRDCDRWLHLRQSEVQMLATAGAFRVVVASDLWDHRERPADASDAELRALREAGLLLDAPLCHRPPTSHARDRRRVAANCCDLPPSAATRVVRGPQVCEGPPPRWTPKTGN